MEQQQLAEVVALMSKAQTLMGQAMGRLVELGGGAPNKPMLSSKELARVEQFGEVAHRHLLVIEAKHSMTLGESLEIRRHLFGDKVQATANLFGVKGSGALFYRNTPYGKARHDADPVCLTEEGERIAGLWRELHPEVAE